MKENEEKPAENNTANEKTAEAPVASTGSEKVVDPTTTTANTSVT